MKFNFDREVLRRTLYKVESIKRETVGTLTLGVMGTSGDPLQSYAVLNTSRSPISTRDEGRSLDVRTTPVYFIPRSR